VVKEAVKELAERRCAGLWVKLRKTTGMTSGERGGRMNEPLRIVEISDYL
jgi:hypothetical protein